MFNMLKVPNTNFKTDFFVLQTKNYFVISRKDYPSFDFDELNPNFCIVVSQSNCFLHSQNFEAALVPV